MPPSGAIFLTNLLTLPTLVFLGWMLLRLWKLPRWGGLVRGVLLICGGALASFIAASAMYQSGGPMLYALMAYSGYLMLAAPLYLIVGLILVPTRKALLTRAG